MDNWNPEQYNRFQNERAQPFWDLADKVDYKGVRRMLDLGCGTGELTEVLQAKKRIPHTVGIDSSPAMMEKALTRKREGLDFQLNDLGRFVPSDKFDLIFSNAALQWVENHEALFTRILKWLDERGQIAIQMPYNFDHPSHFLATDVAQEMKLQIRVPPVLPPETYATFLHRNGFPNPDVTIKVYLHPMKSGHEIVEWTKGTLLTFYQRQLDLIGYKKFIDSYTQRVLAVTGDGPYLYPFKRLFLYGRKS
ncbi:MAG: methyltransferase domain-containing protein [Bdellovibrionales bacterium]